MAGRLTTARRGRWIAAAAGLVCVGVVAWLGIHWRELHVRYLLGRLEGAESFEEARELLETVTWHGDHAEAVRTFVEALGPQRQRALFWFLGYLVWDSDVHPGPGSSFIFPPHWGNLAPLATSFCDRAAGDGRLLRDCSSYLLWRDSPGFWEALDSRAERQATGFRESLASDPGFDRIEQEQPGTLALTLSAERMHQLALASLAGMDLPTLLAELPQPNGAGQRPVDPSNWLNARLTTWLKPRWRRLTYDPAELRCKLLPEDAPDDPRPFAARGYPAPSLPLPDWEGPVPEVPGMIR